MVRCAYSIEPPTSSLTGRGGEGRRRERRPLVPIHLLSSIHISKGKKGGKKRILSISWMSFTHPAGSKEEGREGFPCTKPHKPTLGLGEEKKD